MISIEIDCDRLTLCVTGHAGYAETGKDIVCAAASMLTQTLAARCAELAGDGEELRLRLVPGEARLAITPNNGRGALYTETFRTIRAGFEALSHSYPACVRFV